MSKFFVMQGSADDAYSKKICQEALTRQNGKFAKKTRNGDIKQALEEFD